MSAADERPRTPRGLAGRMRAQFEAFVNAPGFSCLGARAAVHREAFRFGAYAAMASGMATAALAADLEVFARESAGVEFTTFVAAFVEVAPEDEDEFEARLWSQLRALHALDPAPAWDPEVSDDPDSPRFSFSFAGRAFFVVGLHPGSSRLARRFGWPVLVFNPHAQFQRLRADGRYPGLRGAIRRRELALQGTLNPNLGDFGEMSDARQYSGRAVEPGWTCPFHRALAPASPADGREAVDGSAAPSPSPSTLYGGGE